MLILDRGRIALRWYGDTVLLLSAIGTSDPISASFPCARAGTQVEEVICASRVLASLDRSVAEAYAIAMSAASEIDEASARQLKIGQIAWLKQPDASGADATALERVLRERLKTLSEMPG